MGKFFHQGFYKCQYPEKYNGDPSNIVYRSSWELRCMIYLDKHPKIKWWSSEEIVITYRSPIDSKKHRYFPDFLIRTADDKTFLWEVKPADQTVPPKPRKRTTKKYLTEVAAWGVNTAKWEAARKYCLRKGWKFSIVTEKTLGIDFQSYKKVAK